MKKRYLTIVPAIAACLAGCVSGSRDVSPMDPALGLDDNPLVRYFSDLPEEANPTNVAKRITDHFLECPPDEYKPKGYKYRSYGGKCIGYPIVSLWVNALSCARLAGDKKTEDRLIAEFEPFIDGEKKSFRSPPVHVDWTIFGALPYQIFLLNGDPRCLEIGNYYADRQWTPPNDATLAFKHTSTRERQFWFWNRGYTPQTRLWIDDMYMITVLQSQAYLATGDYKYMERAGREMCLYLKELQRPSGLFYHAPDTPFVWGRGDGWMAGGMAMCLKYLKPDDPSRPVVLAAYRKMMAALLKYQKPDGMWGQLVDEPSTWSETSGSAMFTYAFLEGVKYGWLDEKTYGPAARRGWIALVGMLDEYANLKDVCIGTGKRNDHDYYVNRQREAGDPHGQAAMMWMCNVLLDR